MERVACGLRYTAAPFNGWYMGTETARAELRGLVPLHLLPVVGAQDGRSTPSTYPSLFCFSSSPWCRFTLRSFTRSRMRLHYYGPHHSSSNAFDNFEAIESDAGRVVHSNWSWIVPIPFPLRPSPFSTRSTLA